MPIIHIQTESVEALSRQMANLSDDLHERSQQMVHSLNAADWDGPNKERFLAEVRAWQRESQEQAETKTLKMIFICTIERKGQRT